MSKALDTLFGSSIRTRLFFLFFKSPTLELTLPEIVSKTKGKKDQVRRELNALIKIELFHLRSKKKVKYFSINKSFPYFNDLSAIVNKSEFIPDRQVVQQIRQLGHVKLAVISGRLIKEEEGESEADLLIVGDKISQKKVAKLVSGIESEIGEEICYAVMEVDEFMYRRDMFDRFTLQLLKSPHRELINKLPEPIKKGIE